MYCPKCAVRLVEEANFCHHCGLQVAEDAAPDYVEPDESGKLDVASDSAGDEELPESALRPAATESAEGHSGDKTEQDVWDGGFCPKAMAASFVATVAISLGCVIGLLVALVRGSAWLAWTSLVVMFVVCLVQVLRVARRYLSVRYRLTDRRLFVETGLMSRHKEQFELARVSDVRIRQGVLQRFLDVGTIELLFGDRRPRRVVLEAVNDADGVAENIRSLASRAREPQPRPREPVGGGR